MYKYVIICIILILIKKLYKLAMGSLSAELQDAPSIISARRVSSSASSKVSPDSPASPTHMPSAPKPERPLKPPRPTKGSDTLCTYIIFFS